MEELYKYFLKGFKFDILGKIWFILWIYINITSNRLFSSKNIFHDDFSRINDGSFLSELTLLLEWIIRLSLKSPLHQTEKCSGEP